MGNFLRLEIRVTLGRIFVAMFWCFIHQRQCFRATAFTTRSTVPSQLNNNVFLPTGRRTGYATIGFQRLPRRPSELKDWTYLPSLAAPSVHCERQQRRAMFVTSLQMRHENEGVVTTTTTRDSERIHSNAKIPAWQKELNPTQIEAVTKPVFSVTRVVAGPGSGKTRVLTSRIAYLLKEDPRSRILAVTFTRKAAGEMQHRLETLLRESSEPVGTNDANGLHSSDGTSNSEIMEEEFAGDASSPPAYVRDLSRVTLGTFHKICADILRYNGNVLASLPSVERDMVGRNATLLDGRFAIMDQSDQLRIMKDCLAAAQIDLKDSGGIKPLVILNALGQLRHAINKGEDPFQTSSKQKKMPKQMEIAKKIYGLYRESMFANNLLDFDDLIYLSRELLMEHQEIRQQLHRRWTHILVDEYQDTSRAQIDLVRLWTSSSLLVVGDGDQSIYSWRGADPNSLSTFDEEFKSYLGDIETVHLTENYRSTSNIVNAAQKVIASGETSLAEKIRQNMTPKRGSGSTPRIVACADGKAEAKYVIKTILNKIDRGEYTPEHSVAILYRTNVQSRLLEEACVEHNLPYVILGKATSFYKRKEVKDCLCFLRWLYNGRDKGSMVRAIQTPSRGLGDKAIEQFEKYCDLVGTHFHTTGERQMPTPLDILLSFTSPEITGMPLRNETISTRPLKLFTQFAEQMQIIKDVAQSQPVENVLSAVIDNFELMSHLDKTSDSKAEFAERQSNVQELLQATRRYNQDGPCLPEMESSPDGAEVEALIGVKSPLGTFLDDVALVTEIADNEKVAGEEGGGQKRFVVSLMTIHASKGMEFDGVFVTGNEDENFPTSQAIQAGKDSVALAEECRLCYVAMTRAKTDLFLTWRRESTVFAPNSATGFRTVNRNRSRFLDALVKSKNNGTSAPDVPGTKDSHNQSSSRNRDRRSQSNGSSMGQARGNVYDANNQRNFQRTKNGKSYGPRTLNQPTRRSATSSSQPFPSRSVTRAGSSSPPRRRNTLSVTEQALKRQRSGVPARVAEVPPPTPSVETPNTTKKSSPRQAIDSTWFFPVGSTVIHKSYGKGLVLNPPPATSPDELLVRVKFEDGQRRDVSARGDELKPEI